LRKTAAAGGGIGRGLPTAADCADADAPTQPHDGDSFANEVRAGLVPLSQLDVDQQRAFTEPS
jgi:hypothetical protein